MKSKLLALVAASSPISLRDGQSPRCFRVQVLLLLLGTCIYGCADGKPQTAPVRGTITLDRKPVISGFIVFEPAEGRPAKGQIQPDGTFILGTFAETDGAILGHHRVAIVARKELPSSQGGPTYKRYGRTLVPEVYASVLTSGIEFDVLDDDNNFDIQLTATRQGDAK